MIKWPWPNAMAAPASLLAVARHEFRMALRDRAGWGGITAACVLAFIDSAMQPLFPMVGGIRASMFGAAVILPPLTVILAAGAARRDEAASAGDVMGARPYPAHRLLVARFLGTYGVVLVGYLLVIVAGLAASLAFAGRVGSPLILVHAFLRGIAPLFFITVLAYCAVTVARNVLASGVVIAYWLFTLVWGDYLARIFNVSLTQNWPTYAVLGLAILVGTVAWVFRCSRPRGQRAPAWRMAGWAALLLAAGLGDAVARVATSHDKPLHFDHLALCMASQHLESSPRAPGFWLPDQYGHPYRLAGTEGQVLVVGFWSPHVPDSVQVLDCLQGVASEFGAGGVTCVAICVADDHAISSHVARQGGYRFPMVTDTATHFTKVAEECSPMAEAYVLKGFPCVFVTDRGRRLVSELAGAGTAAEEAVVAQAREAMTIPVPPS